MRGRRTKIVATLGPATDAPDVLDRLLAAGLDCARLNCSHGDADDLRRRARPGAGGGGPRRSPARVAVRPAGPEAAAVRADRRRARSSSATRSSSAAATSTAARAACVVDLDGFASLVTERSEIVDRRRRAAARGRAGGPGRRRGAGRSRPARSARARASTSPSRGRSFPRSPRRTSPTSRWPPSSAPTSSPFRSCAQPPTSRSCAIGCSASAATARRDRQDREGRGVRAPRRDHRASPTA